jgi:uncharacterized protein DUF2865
MAHSTSKTMAAGLIAGLTALAAPLPAQAGFFDQLFGGLRHALRAPRLPDAVREYAPSYEPRDERATGDAEGGASKAFCVRTCDGHFFPVNAQPGLSAADACHAFCPASQTAIYSGGGIDNAVAQNGSRYADLPKAFLYRKQLIAGCTCNGHDQFGLARIDINADPTLRPGDVVATTKGMVAFAGRDGAQARFSPARGDFAKMQIATPIRLATPHVKPQAKPPVAETTGSAPRSAQR